MMMNLGQAIRDAMDLEMARDPNVFIIGEEWGKRLPSAVRQPPARNRRGRVVNTPISESL
jgi:pyruvate/2-oxoglutarate/acetoin dehydrogenase E1 component